LLHFPWRWPPSAQCFHQVSCLGLCTSPQCMDGPPRDSLLDCGVGILPGHPPGGVRTNHFPHPLRHIMTTFVCTNLSSFQFNHRFSLPHLFWVITQGGGNAFRPQTTRLICLPIFLPIYLSLLVVPPLIGVPHSLVSHIHFSFTRHEPARQSSHWSFQDINCNWKSVAWRAFESSQQWS